MEASLEIFYLNVPVIFVFSIGIIIGSFLNVVIYRLPAGESLVAPPSSCPHCSTPLKWRQLIPIISFLWQRRRCAYCQVIISYQYLMIELVTGLIFVAVFLYHGYSWLTPVYWVLMAALLAVTIIDLRHLIIPDLINLTIFILGLSASLVAITIPLSQALLGSLIGGGLLWALAFLFRGGMGGGDIKLAFGLGLFTGWQLMLLLLFLASLIGAIYGIGQIMLHKQKKGRQIPFGPFLALAGVIVIHWGWEIIAFYLAII
jgi:leader peptidase (prepilin peptidase)/N-methyltransferase